MKFNLENKYFLFDTFSNAFYVGSKFLYNIVIFSFLINSFPLQDYGVYIFFASLMSQFEFIQSGFSKSLERYIPLYNDIKQNSNLIFLVAFVYLIFGLIFSSVIYILDYYKLFSFLNSEDISKFLILLIYFVPLIWFFKAFSVALRAFKDYRFENLINISLLIVDAILIFYAVKKDFSLKEILLINLSILLLRFMTHTLILFKRHKLNLKLINRNVLISQLDLVKGYSFWSFLRSFSSSVTNQSDKIFVSILLGPSALPIYYGINQFLKLITLIHSTLNTAVIPYFSKIVSKSSKEDFNELALNGTNITTFITFFITSIFILFSNIILISLSRDYLLEYKYLFIIGLFFYSFLGSKSFINNLYLCRGNSVKILAKLSLISTFIYPIILILISSFYGLKGAIFSQIINQTILFPIWLKLVLRITNLNPTLVFKVIIKNIIKFAIIISPFYLLNNFLMTHNDLLILSFELLAIAILVYFIFQKSLTSIKILVFKKQ